MSIYFLDETPQNIAEYLTDRDVTKSIVFITTILSTAHRVLDGQPYTVEYANSAKKKMWRLFDKRDQLILQARLVNDPSAVWTRDSVENYNWAADYMISLLNEHNYRFKKPHKLAPICWIVGAPPEHLKEYESTNPITKEDIDTFRQVYRNQLVNPIWTRRERPSWLVP